MNRRKMTFIVLVMAVAIMTLAVGSGSLLIARAEEPQPEPGGVVNPQSVASLDAVSSVIPVQGMLTDASGIHLNGGYEFTFRLYNAATGGTALCEHGATLTVVGGRFNGSLVGCDPSVIDGQQLYLAVKVGDDPEMTPRQPIYPVPYAWSLRPGAVISGSLDFDTEDYGGAVVAVLNDSGHGIYAETNDMNGVPGRFVSKGVSVALFGENLGGGVAVLGISEESTALYGDSTSGRGVYGESWTGTGVFGDSYNGIGVHGDSYDDSGVEGFNHTATGVKGISIEGVGIQAHSQNGVAIQATGTGIITSTAETYLFVPGAQAVLHSSSLDASLTFHGQGRAILADGLTDSEEIIFPVTLPGVLYGQPMTIKEIDFSYKGSIDTAKVTKIEVYRSEFDGSYRMVFENDNGGLGWSSTSWDNLNFSFSYSGDNVLSVTDGFFTVRVFCDIPAGQNITFNGLRVKLGHE